MVIDVEHTFIFRRTVQCIIKLRWDELAYAHLLQEASSIGWESWTKHYVWAQSMDFHWVICWYDAELMQARLCDDLVLRDCAARWGCWILRSPLLGRHVMLLQYSIGPENWNLIWDETGSWGTIWIRLNRLVTKLIDITKLESLIQLFKCLYLMNFVNHDGISELIFTIELNLKNDKVSICRHYGEFHV